MAIASSVFCGLNQASRHFGGLFSFKAPIVEFRAGKYAAAVEEALAISNFLRIFWWQSLCKDRELGAGLQHAGSFI